MPLALRAHALWKSYAAGVLGCSARIWVLRGASLELHEGECVAILGARGAGTTTLLHCLAGLRRTDAGTIEHRRPPILLAPHVASAAAPSTPSRGQIFLVDDAGRGDGDSLRPHLVREADVGATTVVATHELSSVRHIVHRALLLRDGRLTALPLSSGSRRVAERAPASPVASDETRRDSSDARVGRTRTADRRERFTAPASAPPTSDMRAPARPGTARA